MEEAVAVEADHGPTTAEDLHFNPGKKTMQL